MEATEKLDIRQPERKYLSPDFKVENWAGIEPYFEELANRQIHSVDELRRWMEDRSELESALGEEAGWRYIRMTCDTASEEKRNAFQQFVEEIEPKIAPYEDQLNRKLVNSDYVEQLDRPEEENLLKHVRAEIEIYREENIPIKTELQTEQQRYGAITGAMTVEVEGEELTLQRAATYLETTDRQRREEVYKKIQERRLQDQEELDKLFDKLVSLRHQMARNADFINFRDFMFKAMGRFDYTPEDCFRFHSSVKSAVVPLMEEATQKRKTQMGLDPLRPWDTAVDPRGRAPLQPFGDSQELLRKSVEVFHRLDPFLGQCLEAMGEMGHLDLESRKGKAPGGYNYPLDETGVPFIFMNATHTLRDMVTLMHEGGHAVHSFLTRDLPINFYQHTPSEVAELASMSMELLTMDHWDVFFQNEEDLKRAKTEHLEQIVYTLPWIMTIDKFQHWLYENPNSVAEARREAWVNILQQFSSSAIDWSDLEQYRANMWQKQLHLFEVPFYYIEYGIAQLGAVAVWKNYRENPTQGLKNYLEALKLGFKRPIGEIYETAGIRFDFSEEYIRELMDFLQGEIRKIGE